MKIEIEDDVFEIVKRLKEIDDGYFVLYDTCKNRFEVHNYYQENTYCLMCPYDVLDDRLIDIVNSNLCGYSIPDYYDTMRLIKERKY